MNWIKENFMRKLSQLSGIKCTEPPIVVVLMVRKWKGV
jgi:hypothetical protein